MDYDKLYEALATIQRECKNHECAECPMENEGVCRVKVLDPEDWKLKKPDFVIRLME